jgi:hypothetical protein
MENWKDIIGYEGSYQISDIGNVRSISRAINDNGGKKYIDGMILKLIPTNGYLRVALSKNSKHRKFSVHRLVAIHFIANDENKRCVNHKDSVRSNNHVSNLEWCTHSENTEHAVSKGRMVGNRNEGLKNEKNVKSRRVLQISKQGVLIGEFPSLQEVNRLHGFHHANVGACARGELKTAYGFKWQYK